ncbi:MAG: 3-isopropylmalate dehydratase small subunit [Christensenellaceae bacterium]|jgi:3-isopropylmalate/(R)-2-methylmalate dehydratase small subunit|nr:3-isopropylmalate dehydratase small subunit [Christensenellaceae bacterium]
MITTFVGKAVVLSNNIDTDQIYPGRYLSLIDPKEIGAHCLEGVDSAISPNFEKNGVVLAGSNFGCGSSREHAPIALLSMGASVVIAESFSRIFFRNAINLGLPLLTCKGANKRIRSGQMLEIDIMQGTIRVVETGEILLCDKIGEHAISILEAGGIKPLMRKRMGL